MSDLKPRENPARTIPVVPCFLPTLERPTQCVVAGAELLIGETVAFPKLGDADPAVVLRTVEGAIARMQPVFIRLESALRLPLSDDKTLAARACECSFLSVFASLAATELAHKKG